MFSKIISEIKNELEKQGISQAAIARRIGEEQKNVNNLLAGRTKRINIEMVEKLRGALGMVAEPQEVYDGGQRFQVVQEIAETTKPSSPIAAAILGIVEAMSPEEQAEALKQLTDQFTASRLKEKS